MQSPNFTTLLTMITPPLQEPFSRQTPVFAGETERVSARPLSSGQGIMGHRKVQHGKHHAADCSRCFSKANCGLDATAQKSGLFGALAPLARWRVRLVGHLVSAL